MQGDFRQPPVMNAGKAAELFSSRQDSLHRDSHVVPGLPLRGQAVNTRELSEAVCQDLPLGTVAWPIILFGSTFVQLDDWDGVHLIADESVVLRCVVASIGQNVRRSHRPCGVSEDWYKALRIAHVSGSDLYMERQLMGSVNHQMNLVPEPPVVSPVLVLLLGPVCVGIGWPTTLRVSGDVAAIYGDYLPQVGKVVPQLANSDPDGSPYQAPPVGELGNKAAVGGFARNGCGIQSTDHTERGVALEPANERCDGGDVQDVASEVAMPEGFYGIALAATMNLAVESLEEFAIVNGLEDSFQLGNEGCTTLICRTPKFIIVRNHREAYPFLWSGAVRC